MSKKFWISFVATYVVYEILEFLIHGVLLKSTYMTEEVMKIMRSEADMKMWIIYVAGLFFVFFFCLIFAKGMEGKGLMEGVRFGFYVGMMVSVPMAYVTYATQPIPYTMALQWFIYGLIVCVVIGAVMAQLYQTKAVSSDS
ncbi:MAG: hypothetical protein CO128_11035 [Ignavibacteriales bacterium CG_4_9_14_3_um_filter_30_11]|nr:MAG: hypothetical protein CO128_11035 [Ignavibacteriales bacterium CG_4_9_14_3_um_filter_30_11]